MSRGSGGPSSPLSFVQPFWCSLAVFVQLTHTSCVEFFSFSLPLARQARISCIQILIFFFSSSFFSLSGFSGLLSSVIYRILFQASLFPFFLVLNFVSFERLTVGIPELILASFAHWFCHLLSLF